MIKVTVQQRYPVQVEVQPQNGIQVKAYQAGPPGTQGPPGGSPVIGPNQVAFGAPGTGEIMGSANLVWNEENTYLNIASSLVVGKITGAYYGIQALPGASLALYASNGTGVYYDTAYTFYTAPGAQSFVQLAPGQGQVGHYATRASFYGNIGGGYPNFFDLTTDNNVKIRGFATNVRLHGGVVATDIGVRVDVVGAKFGPYWSLDTANSYVFEVIDSAGNSKHQISSYHVLYNNANLPLYWYHNGGINYLTWYDTGNPAIARGLMFTNAYTGISAPSGVSILAFIAGNTKLSISDTETYISETTTIGKKLNLSASVSGLASLNIASGSKPSTLNSGDFFHDGDLKAVDNGVSRSIFTVISEVPAGLINGSNATFTTAFDFVPETVEVFLNGLKLTVVDDYNTSGNDTITFSVSPEVGDEILVNYSKT